MKIELTDQERQFLIAAIDHFVQLVRQNSQQNIETGTNLAKRLQSEKDDPKEDTKK